MPPSCALLGGFAIGARVALLWQITRTLARRGHSRNCVPYMASGRGWLAGDWPSTGDVLNITAAVWTAGFQWWRSGDITRTQNVSEYMLVLALCLVTVLIFTPRAVVYDICAQSYTHAHTSSSYR